MAELFLKLGGTFPRAETLANLGRLFNIRTIVTAVTDTYLRRTYCGLHVRKHLKAQAWLSLF